MRVKVKARFDEGPMKQLIWGACLAIALASAVPAHADLATAVAAYDVGDFEAAAAEFRQLGRTGNAEAQYRLGLMHERGEGVAANDTTAWSWFKRAADGNHVAAQMRVAESYDNGRGVPMSRAEAYKWYKRAAESGNARAKAKVGLMNIHGHGKKPNYLEGVRWLREAAQAGDHEAQTVLDELAAQSISAGS